MTTMLQTEREINKALVAKQSELIAALEDHNASLQRRIAWHEQQAETLNRIITLQDELLKQAGVRS